MFLRLAAVLLFTAHVHAAVVISQVYGGGGNSGAPYLNDFIEIFNAGNATVNLANWSVQYASADSAGWEATALSGFLEPGQYLLVRQGSGQTGDGVALPAPDVSDTIPMNAISGKVALVDSPGALSGACPSGFVDLVIYGSTTCPGVSPAGALNNQTAALRLDGGCTDTGNDGADFEAVTPAPRNRSSARHPCGPVDEPPSITPLPLRTVDQDAPPFDVEVHGSDDHDVYDWSADEGPGIELVTIANGQGTSSARFTVKLVPGFSGPGSFFVHLSDGEHAVTLTVNISVTPAGPPPLDHVVISQIYSSGGSAGALFRNDYVELYNPTTAPFDLSDWTLQYASATGTSWRAQALAGTIGPGEYYLIALVSGGGAGSVLPPANVEGGFNMSATAGKLALVRSDDARDDCPTADPLVVDLVGYGADATCREGSSNAPAGSVTLAIFRRSETDVNGADFETAPAAPRRTAPIAERGPAIRVVDPFSGASNAPRDASVTVTFSEAVEMTSQAWFGIQCTVTGTHADATTGHSDDARTWIITPNVNFQPGEQCTVTIVGSAVRDVDLDDSAGTDTLPGNHTWKFTIATGAPPPYPPEVHLAMGTPSEAGYLMMKPEYALSYDRERKIANWVSWHLDDLWTGTLARNDTFRADPAVPAEWVCVLPADYAASGFDRGHLVPNADRNKETSVPINQATYLMTNMIPQAPDNNQGPWVKLESYLRTLLPANELYIVAGGAGTGGTGDYGFATALAGGSATVPAQTWKVALVLPKSGGDDVARVDAATRTIAVILPNAQGIRSEKWEHYLVTVDRVEELTGYDFFANVRDAVERAIEAGTNGANPPGVASQSLTTSEDTPLAFALDAVSSSAATYAIAGPAHGSLTGSGVNRTYTPLPDFNGTDSFTFRLTNSAGSSGTATATIAVAAVNDPPLPADDSRSLNRNATLQFSASELAANDFAGPPDERNQTLTVTGVTATAETHGSVALNGGILTYAPAAGYTGAASFAYTVCDNLSLCATGTVHVTVIRQSRRRAVRS